MLMENGSPMEHPIWPELMKGVVLEMDQAQDLDNMKYLQNKDQWTLKGERQTTIPLQNNEVEN